MKLFREEPGIISKGPCWVLSYGKAEKILNGKVYPYMITGESLWFVLKEYLFHHKNDGHLVS